MSGGAGEISYVWHHFKVGLPISTSADIFWRLLNLIIMYDDLFEFRDARSRPSCCCDRQSVCAACA